MRQPTDALGRISCPLRSRGSHLESGALFPLSLYWQSLIRASGCLLLSAENWIFWEMSVFLGAMPGSTVDTVYASTLALGRTPFGFEWRRVPSRCFWLQFCSALFALGILDVFHELHVADSCDEGWIFRRIFSAFFCLLFGVEALPIHPEVLWIYTLAHVSLNNNNNSHCTSKSCLFPV